MASSEVSEVFTSFEDGLRADTGSTVDVVSVNDHSSLAQIEIDSGVIDLSEIPNSRTTHVMS